jgi:tripartite-type tricarboxylate transporter receptor subunit TctC
MYHKFSLDIPKGEQMRTNSLLAGGPIALAFACAVLGGGQANAQDGYPVHSIKFIVGYAPGGGADIMGRLIAQQLSESLRQSVVVENRPGAGQNIAASLVAKAPPDGYTLLVSSSALALNISLYPKLDYDPLRDFAPVAVFAQAPNLLVVREALPVSSVADLIASAKKVPGAMNFSSSGSGSTQHLAGELFKLKAGIGATHIPYKGTIPSVTAVISGDVDFTFANIPSVKQFVLNHKLKALAITSVKRSPLLPDIPTLDEAGIAGMDVAAWYGVLAPAGTPPAVIAKLNAAISQAVQRPEFQKQLEDLGADPIVQSPEFFKRFLAEDIARWEKIIKVAHAKAE